MTPAGLSAWDGIVRDYAARRPRSSAIHERARRSMPGGQTRSVVAYEPFPVAIESGHGAILTDVDGLSYIDLVNNYTSLVHGNAFAPISAAIARAASEGTVFAAVDEAQLELAEALIARIPAFERVRFANSGSEASALAARIARFATGRRRIVVTEGSYHGAVPPFSSGEPEIIRVPFNESDAVTEAITHDTAAVFLEPFLGAGGVLPASHEFLRAARARARDVGAVFVVDEVQALRSHFSGVSDLFELDPDLITLGKLIGGGVPIGAVGGRAELMDVTDTGRAHHLGHAGTFNGNALATRAGLVALQHLTADKISALNDNARTLEAGIRSAAESAGMALSVTRFGSILNVHPGADEPRSAEEAARAPKTRAALHLALLDRGVYTTPRGMINLSTALTASHLEAVVAAYATACDAIFRDTAGPIG